MNILILGNGVEGKSAANYFKHDPSLFEHTKLEVLDHFKKEELLFRDFSKYDLVFRTPSVPPKFIPAPEEKITSVTKYFFNNCPAPIIGVTGTKGKGTTCSFIRDILEALIPREERKVHLVGNIGIPALDILPEISRNDVVVYELSSFQLWDLKKSPAVSVILRLEPDHLDVHESFKEYLDAKKNIVLHQTPKDYVVFFSENQNTKSLADSSPAQKLPFPTKDDSKTLAHVLDSLSVPGPHNREDAEAAILACFAYYKHEKQFSGSLDSFLKKYDLNIKSALKNFQPLPHHLEFVRELHDIAYYDDSFSTVSTSLEAALNAFPETPFVLIVGGKDKGFDLAPVKRLIFDNKNLIKAVLIGETANKLSESEDPEKFFNAGTDFELAIKKAQEFAEQKLTSEETNSDTCLIDAKPKIKFPIVILSPCASSFDMFENYKERGNLFKQLVNNLK